MSANIIDNSDVSYDLLANILSEAAKAVVVKPDIAKLFGSYVRNSFLPREEANNSTGDIDLWVSNPETFNNLVSYITNKYNYAFLYIRDSTYIVDGFGRKFEVKDNEDVTVWFLDVCFSETAAMHPRLTDADVNCLTKDLVTDKIEVMPGYEQFNFSVEQLQQQIITKKFNCMPGAIQPRIDKLINNGYSLVDQLPLMVHKNTYGYFLDKKLHRLDADKPALVSKQQEIYFFEGKKHKSNGPAVRYYDKDHNVIEEQYWFYDKHFSSKEEYLKHLVLFKVISELLFKVKARIIQFLGTQSLSSELKDSEYDALTIRSILAALDLPEVKKYAKANILASSINKEFSPLKTQLENLLFEILKNNIKDIIIETLESLESF